MHTLLSIGAIPKPIFAYEVHQHNVWEIVYYTGGQGTLYVGSEEVHFATGDMVFLPPDIPHREVASVPYTNIHLTVAVCDASQTPIFQVHDTEGRDILHLLQMIYREKYLRRANDKILIEKLLAAVEQYVIAQTQQDTRNHCVEKCKRILIANLSDSSFNISAMLAQIDHNEDYVRRIFKKTVGCTPGSYLSEQRIEYAKQLMQISDPGSITVRQIAAMCGFDDPYYFSRAFKKHTGLHPTAYIKSVN